MDEALEPLPGPEGIAERLVGLVHQGVDWDVWGGHRRIRYWDALADAVRSGVYAGRTLFDWFERVCRQISSEPPGSAEGRAELAALLSCGQDREVLRALQRHAGALVLRVRVQREAQRKRQKEER